MKKKIVVQRTQAARTTNLIKLFRRLIDNSTSGHSLDQLFQEEDTQNFYQSNKKSIPFSRNKEIKFSVQSGRFIVIFICGVW